MVRIGLDARSMVMPRPRGTGRNLVDVYRLLPALRPEWEFILYHQRPLEQAAQPENPPWHHSNVRLRQIDLPGDRFDAWLHVRMPVAAGQDRITLCHFPANDAPLWCPTPFVVTIHDLAPLEVTGELSPEETAAFRRGVRRAVRRAQHIVVPSAATRTALEREFGVSPERTTIVPWAPDSGITAAVQAGIPERDRRRVRERYRLAERWLLSFSGSSPRKNATGLLHAWACVPPDTRAGRQLVLTGCEPESYRQQLAALAAELRVGEECRLLGFVPYEDLPTLVCDAVGLLIPSRCEGFGLPVLDAMACGVPVLASRAGSLPEIAGAAALYCDPHAPESIAAGIQQLLNRDVAARLVQKGYEQVRRFNWARTAEALLGVYERCVNALQAGHRRRAPEGVLQ